MRVLFFMAKKFLYHGFKQLGLIALQSSEVRFLQATLEYHGYMGELIPPPYHSDTRNDFPPINHLAMKDSYLQTDT